jgi:hypothetical protein
VLLDCVADRFGFSFVWQFFCLWQAVLYKCWNYLFLITLQEQIDTVTVEGVENEGEEDWIETKTEEDCIELVGRVKCEQEVSVLCCVLCVLWW